MSKISLPSKSMLPGQSDTLITELDNPLGGGGKMTFVTIFYLKSMEVTSAHFDIKVDIKFKIYVQAFSKEGSGYGKGMMDYNVKSHFPSLYDMRYTIKVDFDKDGKNFKMNIGTALKTNCIIKSS